MDRGRIRLEISRSSSSQEDGESEIVNSMVESYLRFHCSYHQDDWNQSIPSAESAYSSKMSEDLEESPFGDILIVSRRLHCT